MDSDRSGADAQQQPALISTSRPRRRAAAGEVIAQTPDLVLQVQEPHLSFARQLERDSARGSTRSSNCR